MAKHTNHNTTQPNIHETAKTADRSNPKPKKRKATKKSKGVTWGGEAIKHGYLMVPALLCRHMVPLGISPNALTIIQQILLHARDDDDLPYPSQARLSELTGLGRRTVQRTLSDLIDQGYLRIVSGKEYGASNRYDFRPLFDVLSSLLDEDEEGDADAQPDGGCATVAQGVRHPDAPGCATVAHEEEQVKKIQMKNPPYGRGRADARAPSPSGGSISPEPEIEGQGEEGAEHLSSTGASISGPEGEMPRAATGETEESESTPEKHGRKPNSNDVRDWFEEAARRYMPQLPVLPSWSVKDRMNAKRLLEEFGPEETMKAVAFLWEHWEGYRASSRGRLNGVPTPGLLYGMRDQVITDMQLGHVPGGGAVPARGERLDERSRRLSRDEYDPSRDATADAYAWC